MQLPPKHFLSMKFAIILVPLLYTVYSTYINCPSQGPLTSKPPDVHFARAYCLHALSNATISANAKLDEKYC